MKEKIIAIIQARTGSTRLPGKVMMRLKGKTVLERVIERVKKSRLIDEVSVATTRLPSDNPLVKICVKNGVSIYRGSEEDVLDRFYRAARLLKASNIVRITADCPLIDPAIIDKVIRVHIKNKSDYTSNTIDTTFPDGEDVEIFTFDALEKAWQKAKLLSEREHVTPYIRKHPKIFKLSGVINNEDISSKRWTLDEECDFKFIELIYNKLDSVKKMFGMNDILKLLKKHPEYEVINRGIMRNEGYLRSVNKDNLTRYAAK